MVQVDAAPAIKADRCAPTVARHAFNVQGTYDQEGVLQAQTIYRAKEPPALWLADS